MITLKNISLKPLLFLFLLTPLLISAQSPSVDRLKTKKKPGLLKPALLVAKNTLNKPLKFLKKNEVEIGIGGSIFEPSISGSNIQPDPLTWGYGYSTPPHITLTLIKPYTFQPYTSRRNPTYSELTLKVKNFIFIYGVRDWSTNTYGELELKNTNLLVENSSTFFRSNNYLFGYEKSFLLSKKHNKSLSFDLGILGIFGKSKKYNFDYSYYFFDNNDNLVESSEVSFDASQTTNLSHNGETAYIYSGYNGRLGYSTTKNLSLENKETLTEDFILGVAPSFALSYELSDHFVLRWRVKPKFKTILQTEVSEAGYSSTTPQDKEAKSNSEYDRVKTGTSTFSVFFKF